MLTVEETVAKYQELVHSQDRALFDEIFAQSENVELISISTEFKGREAVYNDFLIDGIRKSYTSIDLINDGLEVRYINDDLAIAVFQYHTECIKRDTGEYFGINGLETQVYIKEDGKWKILHAHYSK